MTKGVFFSGLLFALIGVLGGAFATEIKQFVMKYWAEIMFVTGVIGLSSVIIYALIRNYNQKRAKRLQETIAHATKKVTDQIEKIGTATAFEKFANSFDGSEYKTPQAELKYLKIKQAHTDKIIEDARLSKSMQLSKEDAEFYNEYKRVNPDK